MAEVIAKLMARLGYTRYGAQGGDWGSGVVALAGRQRRRALHRRAQQLPGRQPADGRSDARRHAGGSWSGSSSGPRS